MRLLLFTFLICLISQSVFASEEDKPLWEYGFGMGFVRYADYPASDQYSDIVLPFPTFQYRGEILRADDRDGGRAYLFKEDGWSLEFSGGGRLPVDSSKNRSREGMGNLPLVLDGGPQFAYTSPDRMWEFQLAPFFSMATDGRYFRENGMLYKAQAIYRWDGGTRGPFASPILLSGTLALEANAASAEYMRTYFEVAPQFATSTRPAYDAVAGFLSNSLSYYQRFSSGRFSMYVGMSVTDYSWSANRSSPLHKNDINFGYGVGFTYVLGESARPSVAPENTEGLINKVRQHRRERLIPIE